MGKLTDAKLKAWMRTSGPIPGTSDGAGLTFTRSRSGTASWVFRYRFAGKQRELTLGNYPDVTLMEARKAATAARARVDAGMDVAAEKRKSKLEAATAGTVRELAEDYMSRAASALAENTRCETRRYLDKDILPRIGHLSAREISGADIVLLVERVAARSDSVARRVFQLVSVIYSHGIAKHIVKANPCAGLRLSAILGPAPQRRERISLAQEELRAILAALPTLGRKNELAIKILLATCVRKGELIRARWCDVDFEGSSWSIPAEHSKSGKGFVVPLAATVVGWFSELHELAGRSEWVLQGLNKAAHMSRSTLNLALKRLDAEARDFSPHDLRSTARSHLAALGVDLIVAERCLNHSLGGLVAVYDQHDYFAERRRALELWATFIECAERAQPWNVTAMRRAA